MASLTAQAAAAWPGGTGSLALHAAWAYGRVPVSMVHWLPSIRRRPRRQRRNTRHGHEPERLAAPASHVQVQSLARGSHWHSRVTGTIQRCCLPLSEPDSFSMSSPPGRLSVAEPEKPTCHESSPWPWQGRLISDFNLKYNLTIDLTKRL